MTPFDMLAALIWAHLLLDYALQGDFMSKAKNHVSPIPGVPFQTVMASHAFLQAGPVYFATGSLVCAAFEFLAHGLIDVAKCRGRLSFNADQGLHLICKLCWVVLAGAGAP